MTALSAIDAAIWTLGDQGCTTDELRAAREVFVGLFAIAEEYAEGCAQCAGTGTPEFGEFAGESCPDCEEVRSLLAKAQADAQPLTHAEQGAEASRRG